MKEKLKKIQIELSFWFGMIVDIFENGFDLNVIMLMIENKNRIKKIMIQAEEKGIDSKDEFDVLMHNEFPELQW